MTFEPTFESIDHDADALPDLEGAPLGEAEGGIEAETLESDAPLEELPPYGEQ